MSYRLESNYKRLGGYIKRINNRNKLGVVSNLQGININKHFMPSVANVIGTDLTRYKIVEPNQFACNRMHVGRDYRLPIAVSKFDNSIIVSPAYDVFKIKDENKLNVDYLMMWVSRAEFDRNCWFYTDTDIRGKLGWDSLCDMRLPIPSIEKQNEIVKEYNTIVNRIELNETLNQKLEETAQALYKHWFVDFEFPNEDGEPYKSSGGEMVYCEEVDGEVPINWETGCLGDLIQLQRGFDLPVQDRVEGEHPIYASTGITQYHSKYKVKAPGIVTGRSGSLGEVFYITEDFWPLNTTLWIKEFKNATPIFAYFVLKGINIHDYNSGSAVPSLNRNYIHMHELIIPSISTIINFENICKVLFETKRDNTIKNKSNVELQSLLLSKMTKAE